MSGYLQEITDRRGRGSVQARLELPKRAGKRRYASASFAFGKYGKLAATHKALDALDALRAGKRVKR